MIVLPDEDEMPVAGQVNGLIGDALRQSVADAELSAGFAARLAAALDSAGQAKQGGMAAQAGSQAAPAVAAGEGVSSGTGQGSEPAEAAS